MELTFCPVCMMQGELGVVEQRRATQLCHSCGEVFTKSATLISEDYIRMYIKESDGRLDHLLDELEFVVRVGTSVSSP